MVLRAKFELGEAIKITDGPSVDRYIIILNPGDPNRDYLEYLDITKVDEGWDIKEGGSEELDSINLKKTEDVDRKKELPLAVRIAAHTALLLREDEGAKEQAISFPLTAPPTAAT